MVEFLESNTLTNIIQFIAAIVALLIYYLKIMHNRRDAAKIILLEIRRLQDLVDELRENGLTKESKPLNISNSWEKYKHIFVRKLDSDEFNLISDYYEKCEIIENSRKRIVNAFDASLDEKARVIQNKLAENILENKDSEDIISNMRQYFLGKYSKEDYTFPPSHPTRISEKIIFSMHDITTTTAGQKLKKYAKVK